MRLTILTLPCRVCRDSYINIYILERKYMGMCPNCRAVSDINKEELLMAVKIVTREKTITVEEEVGVCDRPGCDNVFVPAEGSVFTSTVTPMRGSTTSVVTTGPWQLCPKCAPAFELHLVDRLDKKRTFDWTNSSRNKSVVSTVTTEPILGKGVPDTDEDSEGSF